MKISVQAVCGIGLIFALGGCATNDQGQTVLDPQKVNTFIGQILTPPAQSDDGSKSASADDNSGDSDAESGYNPSPTDKYVQNVSDKDVEVVNGDTYVSVADANGHRHRVFYGHGDQHAQIMARHAQLQRVIAHNGGTLPNHPIAAKSAPVKAFASAGHAPSGASIKQATTGNQPSGVVRTASATVPVAAHPAAVPQAKPAVATKVDKTDKNKKTS